MKNNGVQVFLNTHDPANATKYYRWEYIETWEFHSAYNSQLKYNVATNTVIDRTEQVLKCWRSYGFDKILVGSSVKLNTDVINEMPIAYIEPYNEKLSVLYSINIRQFPLDLKGYNYWEAMKKNTEEVGSIFDPQPNQTVGNVHSVTDPSERVIGYIGVGTSVSKRIFISNSSMPAGWNVPDSYCEIVIVPQNPDSMKAFFGTGTYIPITLSMDDKNRWVYESSYPSCVDCTIKGTNIKPDFWP